MCPRISTFVVTDDHKHVVGRQCEAGTVARRFVVEL
jgi:hypothetical protein